MFLRCVHVPLKFSLCSDEKQGDGTLNRPPEALTSWVETLGTLGPTAF